MAARLRRLRAASASSPAPLNDPKRRAFLGECVEMGVVGLHLLKTLGKIECFQ